MEIPNVRVWNFAANGDKIGILVRRSAHGGGVSGRGVAVVTQPP